MAAVYLLPIVYIAYFKKPAEDSPQRPRGVRRA
jgi:hypothetical protein